MQIVWGGISSPTSTLQSVDMMHLGKHLFRMPSIQATQKSKTIEFRQNLMSLKFSLWFRGRNCFKHLNEFNWLPTHCFSKPGIHHPLLLLLAFDVSFGNRYLSSQPESGRQKFNFPAQSWSRFLCSSQSEPGDNICSNLVQSEGILELGRGGSGG